jgi:membrane-associated phospholipid phosphatase
MVIWFFLHSTLAAAPDGDSSELPRNLDSEVSERAEVSSLPGTLRWGDRSEPWPQDKERRPDTPQEGVRVDPPHGSWAGAGNHFSGEAWKNFVWDDYLATPAVLLPVGLAVSAAAISPWDKQLLKQWEGALGNKGNYSDIGNYTLIGSVIVLGLLLPGEGRNSWDEGWTIAESYGLSYLTDYLLKITVNRPRIGSSGTHSFPSGHATSAFTAATLIERNSGLAFGLPAYGLAAFTGFERVEEGRHYPSDVLAGAAIGTFWASVVDHLHWGSGGKGGIARPPIDLKVGFVDGLHGFDLELLVRF